jgi:hypothetical protein
MKIRKYVMPVLIGAGICLLAYVVAYSHFVHRMAVQTGTPGRESVEPVFQTANHSIIRLFRPAVAVDQALFPGRWEIERFHLAPTNLAGLRAMRPFLARVENVGRTKPNNTGVSTLHMTLRLENGEVLEVTEPRATEQMFAMAGALTDTRLHEFPTSWLEPDKGK